jgi:hypothetical protein
MLLITMLVAVGLAFSTAAVSADGQGRGNGHANKPATQTTKPHADTPKAKTHTTPTTSAKGNAGTAKAETRAAKAETKAARKNGAVTTASVTPSTEITPTTPTTQPVKNAKLEARLKTLLPPDMAVADARSGFKNWGQFVAAAHVSNNLGIPFVDLKARMTGLTPGPTPGTTIQGPTMSLGQAIQSWKGDQATPPAAGGTLTPTRISNEVKKAEDAANADLRRTRG